MKIVMGLLPLFLVVGLSAHGKGPAVLGEQLTFVKILTEGRPPGELPGTIDCMATRSEPADELCVDWQVAIHIPFAAVKSVTIERERLSRETENMRRWLEGEPELPPTDTTVAYGTVLTFRFSDEAAAALDSFVEKHRGQLLDMRIGKERVDAFAFKSPRVTPVLRLRFAHDLTQRLSQLLAPLGARLSVR